MEALSARKGIPKGVYRSIDVLVQLGISLCIKSLL